MFRLLLLFALASPALLWGQNISHVGPSEGLLHPTVYDIVQDPYGFVWIGTRGGLYRYNEGQAKEFSFLDSTSVRRSRNVQSLLVTQDSTLLIGLQRGGVVHYDLTTLRPFPEESLPALPGLPTVIGSYEDRFGTIWLGTSGDGVFYLPKGWSEWVKIESNEYNGSLEYCFEFVEQGDTLWFATAGEQLLYYKYSSKSLSHIPTSQNMSSFKKAIDIQGDRMVIGVGYQGVFELIDGELINLNIPVNNAFDVAINNDDTWVSTDGDGIFVAHSSGIDVYSKQDPYNEILTDQFYNIHEIYDSYWFGTFNGGVAVIPKESNELTKLRKPASFTYSSIQSAISMSSLGDQFWVGFDGDGLVQYQGDKDNLTPIIPSESYIPKVITALHSQHSNSIWLGSFTEGLFKYAENGELLDHYLPYTPTARGLKHASIWSLESTYGDSLWVGTLAGLQLFNGELFTTPFSEEQMRGRVIMDLEFDGVDLWIGTEFHGLYRVDIRGEITHYPLGNPILDLLAFQDHLIIGMEGGGILAFHGSRIDTIVSDEDYITCYGLTEHDGLAYATTSIGLLKLTYHDSLGWGNEVIQELDELQIGLFNRKTLSSHQGKLMIGGTSGIAQFETASRGSEPTSDLIMTNVLVDNQDIHSAMINSSQDRVPFIEISPGTNTLQFLFEVMSPNRMNGVECSYRIKEAGNVWINLAPNERSFIVRELPPGNYSIEVTAKFNNQQGTSLFIPVKINAFVWQQKWFQLSIVGVIFLILLLFIWLYQDRQLRATRLKLVEIERELLEVKATDLEVKSKQQSSELSFQLLKTSSRLELLNTFKQRLSTELNKSNRSPETNKLLQELIREMNRELQSENYWDHFERNYKDLHEEFSQVVISKYPSLTKGEIRLCYLIREKMNNKEISTVLNVSLSATEKAKYRLKKKIGLEKNDALDRFIQEI